MSACLRRVVAVMWQGSSALLFHFSETKTVPADRRLLFLTRPTRRWPSMRGGVPVFTT